jgi:putative phage-type endonuclease
MNRDEFLSHRRTGIGGSDVAAILGLSPWQTPYGVYLEKRGESAPIDDNDSMRWGRYLEPVIRQAYSDKTGREVRVPQELIRSPVHEFMIANLDGVAGGAGEPFRIFEAKTARSADGWGEPGSDQVPQPYLLQVQHYMAVTDVEVSDVAVLIGGSDFRLYEVRADRELQSMLIDAEAEFWQRVQAGEPPEPVTVADAIARWGKGSIADRVMADAEALRAIEQLRQLHVQRAHLDMAEAEWKAIILRALGERDTLVDESGRTLATWKATKPPKRFDIEAFRQDHPELAAQYTETGDPSRRFLIK